MTTKCKKESGRIPIPQISRPPLPPQLTMEEYGDFITEIVHQMDPIKAARQKAIEKNIKKPFKLL